MASLQEVAQRAKVSIATVSRVLNKSDKVVPETRAVVEQALIDLGYRPSRVARRLRMNSGRASNPKRRASGRFRRTAAV